ncbi:hypothetical protein PN36_28025 [Candidatus Thiomargarita nelsonii]|uniref:Uncharacterized protein n=1 Tax=Candidatus Thiomargarita nelsonii TaxID=1003181 RepID=A0A0A6PA58_9GAMM|nr:hypothetical protein PN36_28025 [Candidatus Thiomargarita nelsonii]
MGNTKKQAREERKNRKRQEKLKKAHAFQKQVEPKKQAKKLQEFTERKAHYPVWQFSLLDWEGTWSWDVMDIKKSHEILKKLGDFETRTWGEIESNKEEGSHLVKVDDCPNPQVKERLEQLELDDIDELFSLRLSGKERIFGILEGFTLKILWYDSEHKVWPCNK